MIWALGVALGLALLLIAFLVGRESTRFTRGELPPREATPKQVDVAQTRERAEIPSKEGSPFWWEKEVDRDPEQSVELSTAGDARIERRPNGTIVLSNVGDEEGKERRAAPRQSTPERATPERATPARSDAPSSVDAYFSQLDAIRSEQQSADPKAFAGKLLTAAMNGSTEGFDGLLRDTERMQQEIKAIAPPPSCVRYQEAMLEALSQSRAVLEQLRDAMMRRDPEQIVRVAQEATALQARTTELQAMEKEIRAD